MNQGEYKQCPNGHYYQGAKCPYCKNANPQHRTIKTEIFASGVDDYTDRPTESDTSLTDLPMDETVADIGVNRTAPTTNFTDFGHQDGPHNNFRDPAKTVANPMRGYSGTVFGDEESVGCQSGAGTPKGNETMATPRYGRKLVGWLVSYSFDELGVDYKLYEGRNIIGRDIDCNITVNDSRMSGKHAVLLFRANKYSLTDSQSSHGTFVNDEDIDLEPRYLKDGDIIRMGSTIFKFRTSL